LTVRPRKRPPLRGYAVEIHRSLDGENYRKVNTISVEDLSSMSGQNVVSIEAQQLIRDPRSGLCHLYVSVDVRGTGEVEGEWDTFLLTSDSPSGPWRFQGLALRRGKEYDSREARDATIGIVDGKCFALYKATHGSRTNVALATSDDGLKWKKHGLLKIDGEAQPQYFQLYGSIFAGTLGPIFMGLARRHYVSGCGLAKDFESYIIDFRKLNLETIYREEWKPLSRYEREDYPTHGYMNITYDPLSSRVLIYLEAVDPEYTKDLGWSTQVDRWIMYEVKLPDSTV